MINLNVGYNFDRELLKGLVRLNDARQDPAPRVGQAFGSIAGTPLGSARPRFRLPEIDMDDVAEQIAELKANGIDFNWTMNTSMVDPRALKENTGEIAAFITWLQEIGVRRAIVSHPLVAQIVGPHLPLEISTIAQLTGPKQLALWRERFPSVDKLCVDVFMNRDWPALKELSEAADDVELEILANEFCIHECIDRNSCYDLHSIDVGEEGRHLFNNYPMGNCIRKRITEPVEWLRARFVLPQWMRLYEEEFGVHTFKVSGRTHPTEYILWVTEQYLNEDYRGNLLELWADVQNIGRVHDEYRAPRIDIDCGRISTRFLDVYRRRVMPLDPDLERRALETALVEATR